MCFLAVIGCLRPTTDFETLRKDPKLVFQFVKDKLVVWMEINMLILLIFSPWELKHMVGAFAENLRSMVCLSQPTRVWKHTRGASFQGCLGVILVDLDAVGHKFAANFWPKDRCQIEKTGLCGKNSQTEGGGLTQTHFLMSTYQVIFGMPKWFWGAKTCFTKRGEVLSDHF